VVPQAILGAAGLLTAWRPCETFAVTGVVLAALVMGVVPWALRWTQPRVALGAAATAAIVVFFAALSAVSGWDRAAAIEETVLAGTLFVVVWCGSRQAATPRLVTLFAFGLSLLGVWAIWQVAVGFDVAAEGVQELPAHLRRNAADRLASGRAFASLLLPGHLAALLATALPLLLSRIRRSISAIGWMIGCLLCVIGLVLTYSPVGIGLGVMASVMVVTSNRRWRSLVIVIVLTVGFVTAFAVRSDLADLKPFDLRVDNWKTALWVWSTSPATGVGLGSFGQASQAVPFEVGNHPAHAHNLPLEMLAELGVVGALMTVACAIALIGLIRRLWPVHRELAVAIAVVPLHNLVDFSLYTSGVALPWAILVGWGLAEVRRPTTHEPDARLRLAAVTAAALALALTGLHATSVIGERSAELASSAEERFSDANRARELAPWRLSPVWLCAAAALDTGRADLAADGLEILSSSRWLRPRAASLSALAGRLHLQLGQPPHALAEAWKARRAQPSVEIHTAQYEYILSRLRMIRDDPGR
jgi:hypothetical protein